MFSFTLDIYCTSVRPGRGIPHMWLSLRFLLSFYLLKGFFSSFSWLLLRVKGRGCHTLLKPYETNCGLWIWAIQIKFDWLIDWFRKPLLNSKNHPIPTWYHRSLDWEDSLWVSLAHWCYVEIGTKMALVEMDQKFDSTHWAWGSLRQRFGNWMSYLWFYLKPEWSQSQVSSAYGKNSATTD